MIMMMTMVCVLLLLTHCPYAAVMWQWRDSPWLSHYLRHDLVPAHDLAHVLVLGHALGLCADHRWISHSPCHLTRNALNLCHLAMMSNVFAAYYDISHVFSAVHHREVLHFCRKKTIWFWSIWKKKVRGGVFPSLSKYSQNIIWNGCFATVHVLN